MMEDKWLARMWIGIALAAALTVVTVVWLNCRYWEKINLAAIQAGMTQETLPGSPGVHWVRKECK